MLSFSYFYADPHFGHTNVIKYENRPFGSVEEMNETLIANYNEMVGPRDPCLWLGDCFLMHFDKAEEIMRRLNGRKVLILGNHDRSVSRMTKLGFEEVVKRELFLEIGGRKVRACHYPYKNPNYPPSNRYPVRLDPNEVLIHGHTHGPKRISSRAPMINVGVDAWDYRPVTLAQLEEVLRQL